MFKIIPASLAVSIALILPNTSALAQNSVNAPSLLSSELTQPYDKAWQLDFAKDYAHMILSVPDPIQVTSEKLKEALAKHGYHDIDPDAVFYHQFEGAVSSHRTYNGWAHYRQEPKRSYTMTQAVMLNVFERYRNTFPGTIDVDTGIYTQDATGRTFDERNEVRILSSKLWDIAYYDLDIQGSYHEALKKFWAKNTTRYTQLIRDSYAFSAYKQYKLGLLNQAQYQLAIAILSPSQRRDINVYRFDVYGYDSTDIMLIEAKKGRGGLIYIPGAQQPFMAYRSERQLKKRLFNSLRDPASRKDLQTHFSLYLRQNGSTYSGVDRALKEFATSSWSERYMMMKRHHIDGNVFARLTEQMKARLASDGDTMIKSKKEVQRDYMISIAYSVMTILPVVDVIAPEVGVPLNIGLTTTQFGLGLDKAIHGDTLQERLEGTRMSSINAAIIGATTLIPALAQYGRSLAEATEKEVESLLYSVQDNLGVTAEEMETFSSLPKMVVHPQTNEELLGVKLTNTGRNVLLRSESFSYYREISPSTGRLIENTWIVRAVNPETDEIQWLENLNLPGGGETNGSNTSPESGRSELPELLLPEDLPERPGIGGSGYADMTGGRDAEALELEQKVDPYAYLTDVEKLHEESIKAQQEIERLPFHRSYDPNLEGSIVFRGDGRLPDELFHSGINRHVEAIEYIRHSSDTRGLRGIISTTTDQGIAVRYALHKQRGYVYAIELNHGGRSVDSLLRGESLSEIATLNIPPEDIMFAIGPFTGPNTSYSALLEEEDLRTAELIINPHSQASVEVAQQAFDRLKATLKYPLSSEVSFRVRYLNREELFWHESEAINNR